MIQTLPGDFIDVQGDKNTSADKKIRTSLWSALSWAKDDPKKVYVLSLQAYHPTIAKQQIGVM